MTPTLDYFFRQAWRWTCGLPEESPLPAGNMPPLETLRETEWSPTFERLMRNRLIMGSFRYLRLGDPRKPPYDCIAGIRKRLDNYEATGNLEMLVDSANA